MTEAGTAAATPSAEPRRPGGRAYAAAVAAVLGASVALNAWGLTWGLPSRHGWAPDELLPGDVLEAQARGFSGGWHSKYPPLHYYLLAGLNSTTPATARAAFATARERVGPPGQAAADEAYFRLFLRSRLLSLLMATGVLAAVYTTGRLVTTPRAALFATALAATMPTFTFYAKLANVDVPALFWWTTSLVFLFRTLRGHWLADYVLLAVTASAAVGTKDQMYGLYVLCIPWLLWSRARRDGESGLRGVFRAAVRREPLVAAAVVVALFGAAQGLPWNLEGFSSHFALVTGSASQDFREFSRNLAGQGSLLAQTAANLGFALGWPAFALCVGGVLGSLRGASGLPAPALLAPAVSYHVFFSMVVLYSYDRFVLPVAVLLTFFGGALLALAWERTGPWRLPLRVSIALILLYGAGRCVSLDLAMWRDARYAAEAWLREHAPRPALVSPVGPLEYLPRMDGLEARPLGPAVARLERVKPRFVVASADYAERADPGSSEQALYAGLESGALGYRRVFAHRFDTPWLLLRTQDLLDRPGALVRSNVGKVNPEIRIYERTER